MVVCKIYKYTNKIDGKAYIGKTTNEERRIKSHKVACSKSRFHKAVKQFGMESFDYEILEEKTFESKSEADKWMKEREAYYTLLYQTHRKEYGYNIYIGTHPNQEILDYRSDIYSLPFYQINPADGKILYEWKKRKKLPSYFCQCTVAQALTDNYKHPLHHYYGGFIWIYKKDYTPEYLAKVLAENEKISTRLLQYDLDGNLIKVWHSVEEAAAELGVGRSAIANVLSDLSRMCKKSVWVRPWDDASVLKRRLRIANQPLAHCIPVEQLDKDGNVIRRWNSSTEAVQYFGGKSISSIGNVLSGRRHTAFGYGWRYAEAQK